jgi:peptide/nickel transport system substrate-binding protein
MKTKALYLLITLVTILSMLTACTPAANPTAAPTEAPKAVVPAAPTATTAPAAPAAPTATEAPKPTAAPTATEAPKKGGGGTMVVGRGGDSVILDAAAATDGESWRVAGEVIEPLVRLDGHSTKVIPWLAESWDSPDGATWTFKLRQGVKFTDGTDFNADAVKWNFDRWMNKDNKFRYDRTFEYWDTEFGENLKVEEVKVVDPYTIQIKLATPSAVILPKLALTSFAFSSPKAVEEQGDKYGTAAGTVVGTGPFMFKEWVPNDKITLVANTNWWGDGPKLDALIFRSIPDNSARLAELLAGTINQADLAQTDFAAARADPNVKEYQTPSLGVGYIAFQQCIKPFDNVKVRQAIEMAINRDALVKNFYAEGDKVATSFQPPAIMGSNPNLTPIEYNPEKAKALLAEAGFPNGFSTQFWYVPVIRGYSPDGKAIAEAIAVDLQKIGVKVELKTQDWGAYLAARLEGKFPMWMLGWGSDNGDPDNFIGYHFAHPLGTPKKEDCYANDKLSQLLIDGAKEPDVAKREKIYQQAEQMVYDDAARLPVAWPAGHAWMTANVQGYEPVVFRSWYEKISIAP